MKQKLKQKLQIKRKGGPTSPPLFYTIKKNTSNTLSRGLFLNFLLHVDVSQKTCNNQQDTTPSVPVLVSQIAHERDEGTKNEKQCAYYDEYNTEIFLCIYLFLITNIQISYKITTFSSNHETFKQEIII